MYIACLCLLKSPFLLSVLMLRPTADALLAMMSVLVSLLLSVSNSLSGGDGELDKVVAVGDPPHTT